MRNAVPDGCARITACMQCGLRFHMRCAGGRVKRESGVSLAALPAGLTRGALCASCCLGGLNDNPRVEWLVGMWRTAAADREVGRRKCSGGPERALHDLVATVGGAVKGIRVSVVRARSGGGSWDARLPTGDGRSEAERAAQSCVVGQEAIAAAERLLVGDTGRMERFTGASSWGDMWCARAQDALVRAALDLEDAVEDVVEVDGFVVLMYGRGWREAGGHRGADRDLGGGHTWQARCTRSVLRCDMPGCVAPTGLWRDGERHRPMVCAECGVVAHPDCAVRWWRLDGAPGVGERGSPDCMWDSWWCTFCLRRAGRRPARYRVRHAAGDAMTFRVVPGRHLFEDGDRIGAVAVDPRQMVLRRWVRAAWGWVWWMRVSIRWRWVGAMDAREEVWWETSYGE